MADEEKADKPVPRGNGPNGPEQQATGPEQFAAVDTTMWVDDQAWVATVTVPDATTYMDVTISVVPTLVLAANVANMYAYATAHNIAVRP
jgi:hypothetical protein